MYLLLIAIAPVHLELISVAAGKNNYDIVAVVRFNYYVTIIKFCISGDFSTHDTSYGKYTYQQIFQCRQYWYYSNHQCGSCPTTIYGSGAAATV